MKLSPARSLAGVLEPVFAIRTEDDLGIGDTAGVRQMVDWCHRHRIGIFQTLPINEIGDDNSPYNALSSVAIEPTTLSLAPKDLPDLTPEDFQKLASTARLASLRTGPAKYREVKALKHSLLEAAFSSFSTDHLDRRTPRAAAFRTFVTENESWLSDYSLYRVLMEENGASSNWEAWLPEHRSRESAQRWLQQLPPAHNQAVSRRRLYFEYVQWLAFQQWQALKAYAEARQVYLMGDIPFGIGRSSCDVWAHPQIFDLEWSGGAPPEKVFKVDPFTEKWGQNWGVPNYRWDYLRTHNFDWWRTRVGNVQKIFHLYRIDHVLGLFRIYSFPWTPDRNAEFLPLNEHEAMSKTGGRLPGFRIFPDDTPEHRNANQAQGEEILRVILEASCQTTVIAEDLGVVPEYVHPTLQKLGIPGFRIPMFFRDHDGAYSDPAHYPRLSLAQPATHDHPPLAAAWAQLWLDIDAGKDPDASREELRRILRFAGRPEDPIPRNFTPEILSGYVSAVMRSNSWLAIFQITDVFAMEARFNTPGSIADSNWSYRMPVPVAAFDTNSNYSSFAAAFSRLAVESGRATS
jgi:4-alpha-glucanotransferase